MPTKSVDKEDIKLENIYAPNNSDPKYIQKRTELKEEIDHATITAGDFKILTFNNGLSTLIDYQQENGILE